MHWKEKYDFDVSFLITEARIRFGLTQEKLAQKMLTTQSSIARAERGATLPGHRFLQRMADALGLELIAPRFNDKKTSDTCIISTKTNTPTQTEYYSFIQSL